MKVFHPENNSTDGTGHGPMHIFIGEKLLQSKAEDRVGREVMEKEMRDKGGRRRRRRNEILSVISY